MRTPFDLAAAAILIAMAAGCQPVHPADPPEEDGEVDAGAAEAADAGAREELDAGSELVSTLIVKSDGSAIATPILESGRSYTLVASGDFIWGNCDATACPGGAACGYQRVGDAFHRSDDCWASTIETFEYISLYVDGEQIDWGAYRADHTYSLQVSGAGASLAFNVSDCVECFGDNVGELEVSVYDDGPE